MAEINRTNPLTLTVDQNIEIKAVFERIVNEPRCYSIKNNSSIAFSALYRSPDQSTTSSDSFIFVDAGATSYVCSIIDPYVSRDDLQRSPSLATEVVITKTNTTCSNNQTCEPVRQSTTYTTTLIATPQVGGKVSGTSLRTPTPSTIVVADVGTDTSFSAQENEGYEFVGWFLNNALWSTNRTPRIRSTENNTYEARFRQQTESVKCTCYFVAPTTPGASFDVRYRKCKTGEIVTETFETFTNICSSNIPQAIRNAQVPQDLGTDCSERGTCAPAEDQKSPTPTWRNCLTGNLETGTVPSGYISKQYTGPEGGICYEPQEGTIGFQPSLAEALQFTYTRGSSYPQAVRIRAQNSSPVYGYSVKLTADSRFIFTPSAFNVAPSSYVDFTAVPSAELLNILGDGRSELPLTVDITRA